jgi:hypothetical protein
MEFSRFVAILNRGVAGESGRAKSSQEIFELVEIRKKMTRAGCVHAVGYWCWRSSGFPALVQPRYPRNHSRSAEVCQTLVIDDNPIPRGQ